MDAAARSGAWLFVDLGGRKDLVAFDARRFERGTDLGLVARICAVSMWR